MAYTLENNQLAITFDAKSNRFVSLRNKVHDDEYLKVDVPSQLCQLVVLDPASSRRSLFSPRQTVEVSLQHSEDGDELNIEFAEISNGQQVLPVAVRITLQIKVDEPEILWQIQLHNQTQQHQIVEVLFPILKGLYLGDTWQDNILIYPYHAGEKTVNPVEVYTSERYMNFSSGQVHREGDLWWREINYCGTASMMWMYYYNNTSGLYLSSYDDEFTLTGLRVETGGPENPWMGFSFRKYIQIRPDVEWRSRPYGVAVTEQDWHWGAKRYRQWIKPHLPKIEQPAYLQQNVMLYARYNFKWDGKVQYRFTDIPFLYQQGLEKYQARHLFIAGWNRGGFDSEYPEYHPDMMLGTAVDLADGCLYVREHDGFTTFYINARLFDMDSSYFDDLGKAWAVKDESGEMHIERYSGRRFAVLCPANPAWRKQLAHTAIWIARAYGSWGIYLDQLGHAEPLPCYDCSHGHLDPGEFNRGYLALLQEITSGLQRINSNHFLMIENCGDIYSAYVWGNLTFHPGSHDEHFNVFKYTFPEYTQINMLDPRYSLRHDRGAQRRQWYEDVARALLLGSIFWQGLFEFEQNDEEINSYWSRAIALRSRVNQWLVQGVYVDNDGVLQVSEGIQVSHWILPGSAHLYIVHNPECQTDGFIEIESTSESVVQLISDTIDDIEEDFLASQGEGWIRMPISEATLSYIYVELQS